MMIRVAVIGAGYWGPNLIRNFVRCPSARLVAVCDSNAGRLRKVLVDYPGVAAEERVDRLLARDDVDAVAIATPVGTHKTLGLAALDAGKHVLIEKPLAASTADAQCLVRAARQRGRVLMVDHTFLFSSPVQKMKEIVASGELGDIYYIDSVRINLGLFQHDVNVVWDLAPHDVSIIDHLLGRPPRCVAAMGTCHADHDGGIEDVAHISLDFGGSLMASCHVNWLSPVKIRNLVIGGSRKSLVYNDLEVAEKIKIYDRGITINHDPEARRKVLIGYRTGDIWSPHVDEGEPLGRMVSHFIQCIENQTEPLADGESGLRVVRVLESAQRSIKGRGAWVSVPSAFPDDGPAVSKDPCHVH
jgi:predicted dehydrogenase